MKKRALFLVATIGIMALVSAACGPTSPAPQPGATSPPTAKATEVPKATEEPKPTEPPADEDIFVYTQLYPPENIDPAVGSDAVAATTQKNVYDTLYKYVGNPPELVPSLAESAEVSGDGRTWTIKIREGVTFHNGDPLTAEDVRFSFERMIAINKGLAYLWTPVMDPDNIRVVDDLTVEIALDQPYAPFLATLNWLFIVNPSQVLEHEVDGDLGQEWLAQHEAGSGPFVISQWQPPDYYEFVPYEDYWGEWPDDPLEKVVWRTVRESSSRRLGIEAGELDFIAYMSADEIEALQQVEGVSVHDEPSYKTLLVKFNMQYGPTSDLKVRQAISYAFDYETYAEYVLKGHGRPMAGPIPANMWAHNPDVLVYKTDVDRARQLLAEAGYEEGELTLLYVYAEGIEEERQLGLLLADNLADIGITLNVEPWTWANMTASCTEIETAPDLIALYRFSNLADPDGPLYGHFHSSRWGSWNNCGHYKNEDVDRMLEEARSTTDADQRFDLYQEIQQQIAEDAVELFVAHFDETIITTDRVKGFQYTPTYLAPEWMTIYIEE